MKWSKNSVVFVVAEAEIVDEIVNEVVAEVVKTSDVLAKVLSLDEISGR